MKGDLNSKLATDLDLKMYMFNKLYLCDLKEDFWLMALTVFVLVTGSRRRGVRGFKLTSGPGPQDLRIGGETPIHGPPASL